jgi:hypothetical protein
MKYAIQIIIYKTKWVTRLINIEIINFLKWMTQQTQVADRPIEPISINEDRQFNKIKILHSKETI